jgi:hypothetical protein
LTNGKEIFYYVRSKEDVGETERTRNGGVTGADNREGGTITHNDGGGKGGVMDKSLYSVFVGLQHMVLCRTAAGWFAAAHMVVCRTAAGWFFSILD